MRVFAIDPGPEKSAYVIWDGARITEKEIIPNRIVLGEIANFRYRSGKDILAIEKVCSYGMTVGDSVFETVYWSGRFAQIWNKDGFLRRVPRMDVKMHICHNSRAKDSNIIQALKDRFEPGLLPRQRPKGLLKGLKADLWQAFALAVYWMDTEKGGV